MYYQLGKDAWDKALSDLLGSYMIYAPLLIGNHQDYELLDKELVKHIVYNAPRPSTPLKSFFLPVKENVVAENTVDTPVIILGIPGCDLSALDLLDAFFLDEEYPDNYYAKRRRLAVLIGTDCHASHGSCHCSSYGLKPYPEKNHDISLAVVNGGVYLTVITKKGEKLLEFIKKAVAVNVLEGGLPDEITEIRNQVKQEVETNNKRLPNYQETTHAVKNAVHSKWTYYSEKCVSCGACAAICPTCTCFLLIDRPGFEKVRQLDACQYPGFERMAGGEDPLKRLVDRFRNRYLCKYKYRPEKYEAIACTGCGRCIETCIAKIDKNELLVELTK
ncbi:MAG: 4Fe-4S dicluster domain-containing protein [Bacteroidales bacterium]|nr:4Fe-4S dicluster domain-containing protein [Bacteroidales bacterium]